MAARAWRRIGVAWLVVAMCALTWVAPSPAAAATGWQLSANPTTVPSGQPATIELRLTDTDGSGDIACARIFIGAEFDVLGVGVRGTSAPSPWAAAQAGAAPTTVSVWNADGNGKLKGGDWVDFYVTVRGNTPGSHAWTAIALQNNDCTGDPFLEPISPVITVNSPAPPMQAPTPVPPPPPPPPAAEPIAPPAPTSAFTSRAVDLDATGGDFQPEATGANAEADAPSGSLSSTGDLAVASAEAAAGLSSVRPSAAAASDPRAEHGIGLLMAVLAILGGIGILWLLIWGRRRAQLQDAEVAEPSLESDRPAANARSLGVAGESVDPILAAMGLGRSDPE